MLAMLCAFSSLRSTFPFLTFRLLSACLLSVRPAAGYQGVHIGNGYVSCSLATKGSEYVAGSSETDERRRKE